MIFTHTMSVRFRHPVPVGLLVTCLKLTKKTCFLQYLFVNLHCSSLTSLINTITKLITLLCRDGVTNVMAAWIDSKLLGYNSVAEMGVILSYTVVRFYLSQQIMERWQSGRLRWSWKPLGVLSAPRVRIPASPQRSVAYNIQPTFHIGWNRTW